MNIIFLDVDGVLNCELFYEQRIKKTPSTKLEHDIDQFCPKRIGWLNRLCEETGAKVVLSSTWRYSGLEYCRNIFKEVGATFEIIDITPKMVANGFVRGNEIRYWIMKNKELLGYDVSDFHTYAIIDDDSDMLYEQRNNLFLTDGYSGLTPNVCYRIKRHFEKFNNKGEKQ